LQHSLTARRLRSRLFTSVRRPSGPCTCLARRVGLIERINRGRHVLKRHLPYHESDHVLHIAYNILCGGTCLEDLGLRRNNEVYLDASGARRIPDPTTEGEFCRRFTGAHVETLMEIIHQTRVDVCRRQGKAFFREAVIDVDGHIAETGGECKQDIGMSYDGRWSYHPLIVSLANTREPLYVVNRGGHRPSHEGVAPYVNRAAELCREAGFRRITFQGDTDFSQTAHLDRRHGQRIRFSSRLSRRRHPLVPMNVARRGRTRIGHLGYVFP